MSPCGDAEPPRIRPYGHTTGAELDEVARYLAGLVKRHHLPEKVMVYHQVARSVVRRESGLKAHDGVVLIKSVDGLGIQGPSRTPTEWSTRARRSTYTPGFKLFLTEDRRHARPAHDSARSARSEATS